MSYHIIWDDKVKEFLKKVSKDDAQRIIKKVNSIVDDPRHYLESLVDITCYKLRIGEYRALIDLDEKRNVLLVVFIAHRKNVYKIIQRSGFARK